MPGAEYHAQLAKMRFDEIFHFTAGAFFNFDYLVWCGVCARARRWTNIKQFRLVCCVTGAARLVRLLSLLAALACDVPFSYYVYNIS